MDLFTDLHIHSRISDGENTAAEIIDAAARLGLKRISITDHDAVGAYRRQGMDARTLASERGMDLLPGIELDTDYRGVETHLLGYGIDPDHRELNQYLDRVQNQRRQRIRLQAEALNSHFRRPVVDLATIFIPERETVMKPHLFHCLLQAGLVADYPGFRTLLQRHARVQVRVERPSLPEGIALIRRAGGDPVLAHPGFLATDKGDIHLESLLREMVPLGLAGLETVYPYWEPGRTCPAHRFPDLDSEKRMVRRLNSLARRFKLMRTRGSDAHDLKRLEWFARRETPSL